jgi:hypothetical protein
LGERLRQARRRNKVLLEIFEAVDEGLFEVAARLVSPGHRPRAR